MARNPFTTGFSAGLGVLFAILLFPFILIGGCLLTVGSCGVAAVKSLPKANVSASTPAPERPAPAVESKTSVAGSEETPASKPPKYSSTFKHEIVNLDARGSLRRVTVFVEKPTKADIAEHIQTIRDSNKTATHIYIDYYDDRRAALVSSKGGDKPEWTYPFLVSIYGFNQTTGYNSLTFRHEKNIPDVPQGGPIGGEAALLLKSSHDLASFQDEAADTQVPSSRGKKFRVADGRYLTEDEIHAENNPDEYPNYKKRPPTEAEAAAAAKAKIEEAAALAEEAKKKQAIEDAKYRTWTTADGKFTTEAKLLSYANGNITIETREKKKKSVPLEKLSKADQEFVNKWKRQH